MEEGGDARAPPVRLWVRRIGVYCDENQKTWLVAQEEEAGTLKARIRKVQVPLGEAVRPSRLPASRLPHMWQLSAGQQYRDSNSRIWDIEHHLRITGVEELLLKLQPTLRGVTVSTSRVSRALARRGEPCIHSLDMPQKDPCQKRACEIQKCLQANNYLESKCEAVLQEMRRCCARYPKGRSISCSGFELEEKGRQKQQLASDGTRAPQS